MTEPSEETELRTAIQYSVIQLCSEEKAKTGANISSKAILAMAELTYLYATTSLSNDLEAFTKHANRKTITESDVLLVARKNPNNLLCRLKRHQAKGRKKRFGGYSSDGEEDDLEGAIDLTVHQPSPAASDSSSDDDEDVMREINSRRMKAASSKPKPVSSSQDSEEEEDEIFRRRHRTLRKRSQPSARNRHDRNKDNNSIQTKKQRPRPTSLSTLADSDDDDSDSDDMEDLIRQCRESSSRKQSSSTGGSNPQPGHDLKEGRSSGSNRQQIVDSESDNESSSSEENELR